MRALTSSIVAAAVALELAAATPFGTGSAGKATVQLVLRDIIVCEPEEDQAPNPIARVDRRQEQKGPAFARQQPANIYDPADCGRTKLEPA